MNDVSASPGGKILVVDDEPSIVDAVATALRYEGFEVRELLQCGRVIRPLSFDGAPAAILKLVSTGAVTEIPVPTGRPAPAAPPTRCPWRNSSGS